MGCQSFLLLWRRWIRFVVVVVYIVLLVIAVPLCIWELERNGAPDHVQAWFIGGMFVLMALPISFWGILQHIINYTTPHLQRYIIRILWMVPIYALNAWFALRYPKAAIYLDTLRECYEAYVIYNFMAYLLSFLNHEYPHLDIQIETKPPVKLIFPLCLLPRFQPSAKFIQNCKHGVLQYTVVRPTMTIIALICEMFDKYGEGDFNFTTAWSYIVIINNLSQIFAMYCLILFYKTFKEELQPLKPISKLLCVKAVVFLSFWQSLVIAALAKAGVIPESGKIGDFKNVKAVSTGLQDFVICIEMFVAAIAHYFSFSYKPFVNLAAEQQNCCASFLSMWNVRDVTEDVVEHARYIGRGMYKTLSRGKRLAREDSSERTPLLTGARDGESGQQSSFQNPQDKTSVKTGILDDDLMSSCAESLYSQRYDSFVNKSTTSSMLNYADFRSEASLQQESRQELSNSVSLRGFDSSGEELDRDSTIIKVKDADFTLVDVTAEVAVDALDRNAAGVERVIFSPIHDDETFEHLDVATDKLFPNLNGHSIKTAQHLNVDEIEKDYLSEVDNEKTADHLVVYGDEIPHHSDVYNEETALNSFVHRDGDSHHSVETANDSHLFGDETSHLNVEGDKISHLNVEGDQTYHLNVEGDETSHLSGEGDKISHLNVEGDETAHLSGEGDKTSHLNMEGDNTSLLNVEGDKTSHLNVEGDETSHLNVEGDETSHLNVEGDKTSHLNVEGDETSYLNVEGDEISHLDCHGDDISEETKAHDNESLCNLDFHKDEQSYYSDVHDNEPVHNFNDHSGDVSRHPYVYEHNDNSRVVLPDSANPSSLSDVDGNSSQAVFLDSANPRSLSDVDGNSSQAIFLDSANPRSLSEMQLDSSELLSAESSTSPKLNREDHMSQTEIVGDESHAAAPLMSGFGSEGPGETTEDTVQDDS